MLIDNAIFVTIAKPFHCTKITAAAASVQYIYCKLDILSMNLMSLILQHSSCSLSTLSICINVFAGLCIAYN